VRSTDHEAPHYKVFSTPLSHLEQLDPRKANSESPSKKIPTTLMDRRVECRTFGGPSIILPIATYIQSTNPHTTYLIVSSPLFFDLPGVILHPVKMLRVSHLLCLNLRDNPWWGVQIKRLSVNLSTFSLILLSKTYIFSSHSVTPPFVKRRYACHYWYADPCLQ
jgi:hypothetical protein